MSFSRPKAFNLHFDCCCRIQDGSLLLLFCTQMPEQTWYLNHLLVFQHYDHWTQIEGGWLWYYAQQAGSTARTFQRRIVLCFESVDRAADWLALGIKLLLCTVHFCIYLCWLGQFSESDHTSKAQNGAFIFQDSAFKAVTFGHWNCKRRWNLGLIQS